jgi:hypothetical protein
MNRGRADLRRNAPTDFRCTNPARRETAAAALLILPEQLKIDFCN